MSADVDRRLPGRKAGLRLWRAGRPLERRKALPYNEVQAFVPTGGLTMRGDVDLHPAIQDSRRRRETRVAALLLTGLAVLAAGCLELDGGAVEVAWVVRDTDQRARTCKEADIAHVRVTVLRETDGGVYEDLCRAGVIGRCTFDCEAGDGTTPFKIPAGWYFFGLEVRDGDGQRKPESEVEVPAPTRRRVLRGQMVDLGVWQLVVRAAP